MKDEEKIARAALHLLQFYAYDQVITQLAKSSGFSEASVQRCLRDFQHKETDRVIRRIA